MIQPPGNAQHLRDLIQIGAIQTVDTGDLMRDGDVAGGVECGQKIEFLKDKSNAAAAQASALGVGKAREVSAFNHHAAGSGASESAKNVEESGLAAARWAHDANEFAGLDRERDAGQCRNIDFADAVNLGQVLRLDHRAHVRLLSLQESVARSQ